MQFAIALINSEFDISQEYKQIVNKEGISICIKEKGSFISKEFPVIRISATISKDDFPEGTTIEEIIQLIYNPEIRKKWDTSLKEYELLKGDKECGIVHIWNKKPIIFMSERDSVEKIRIFSHGEHHYSFSSSVSDDFYQEIPNVSRLVNYISCLDIVNEVESFAFHLVIQYDFKMSQSVLNSFLFGKYSKWFKEMKGAKGINSS